MTLIRFIALYLLVWIAIEIARLFTWDVTVFWTHEAFQALAIMFGWPVVSVALETIPPVNA